MGLLADIYVSIPERALDYDSDPKAFQRDSASWKRFTELEMSTLWAALQRCEWDNELADRFERLMVKDGGERLITRFPNDFLRDVLAADDALRDRALAEWAATEELSCDVEEVRPFWDDLKRLAEIAVSTNRGLFLWNCV